LARISTAAIIELFQAVMTALSVPGAATPRLVKNGLTLTRRTLIVAVFFRRIVGEGRSGNWAWTYNLIPADMR